MSRLLLSVDCEAEHSTEDQAKQMSHNHADEKLQLEDSWAPAPSHAERVVEDVNLWNIDASELTAVLEFVRRITRPGEHHKVLVNVRCGWVLTASAENARALSEFVAAQRRSGRHSPYGPLTPALRGLFFRPPAGRVGPRIADHPYRRSRGAHKVVVRVEVEDDDVQQQIRLIKSALATLVARACGVTHNGWLNANTAIELFDVSYDEPLIPGEAGHEVTAGMPRLRLVVSAAVIFESPESVAQFISFFQCGQETRG